MADQRKLHQSLAASRRALALAAFACCLCASPPVNAQSIPFAPIDEAVDDAAWQAYKNRLVTALENRDRPALLDAIHADVENGPGQTRGLDEFRRRWAIEDEKGPVWRELLKAVTLGGAFVKTERGDTRFCTPYVAARWNTDFDPFRFGAIIADDVLVKNEPSSSGRTIARLTYELVPVEDWEVADTTPGFPQKWTKVRVQDTSGFIPEEQIRSPIEHMACFATQGGRWRLVSFTAGYLPE